MIVDLYSPDFWIEQWNASLGQSVWAHTTGYASHHTWNRMAVDYGKETPRGAHSSRDPILEFDALRRHGLFGEGMRVLDVGCGTGRMAIPFAQQGARVAALDFSDGMLARLREDIPADVEDRIEILKADWAELDLAEREWQAGFDLAFASMTPAIRQPESFLKLHRASRGGCCFRGWAGQREDSLLQALWKHLLETDMPSMGWDITLAFNLLRAMGFWPVIEFQAIGWERTQPVDKATDFFLDFFRERVADSEAALRQRIVEFLQATAKDGMVYRRTTGRTGTLIWSVK